MPQYNSRFASKYQILQCHLPAISSASMTSCFDFVRSIIMEQLPERVQYSKITCTTGRTNSPSRRLDKWSWEWVGKSLITRRGRHWPRLRRAVALFLYMMTIQLRHYWCCCFRRVFVILGWLLVTGSWHSQRNVDTFLYGMHHFCSHFAFGRQNDNNVGGTHVPVGCIHL